MNNSENKPKLKGKKQHPSNSSPFDSPTRFAGSAVKGFSPGGSLYPIPNYPPAKPMSIKKRIEGSLSPLLSSCPASVPPPKPQDKSSPPTLPHEKTYTHTPLSSSKASVGHFSNDDMRFKSQQLLSAIKGNSDRTLDDMHATRKVVNQEKSQELMKLLNIKPI